MKYISRILFSTRFMMSSNRSWQSLYHSRKICINVITVNFCFLADDEAPILNCPNKSSTTDEGLNSSSTVLLNSTATDNVDFHLDVNCSHSSEDIFLIGDTTVNCSSTDAEGNTDTCLLVVTVTGVNMSIFYLESSVTDKVQDFEILNFFFWIFLNFLMFYYVILRKFLLDLTFWIMLRKFLIKMKEMYLTIFISTRFLDFIASTLTNMIPLW